MRIASSFIATALLLVSIQSHAVGYPGVKENVMLSCGEGANAVSILSENYTTSARRELSGKPGQMATAKISTDLNAPFNLRHSVSSIEPLELVRTTGWIDRLLGIYENDSYVLEISGRSSSEIELRVKATGEVLQCVVLGDCC